MERDREWEGGKEWLEREGGGDDRKATGRAKFRLPRSSNVRKPWEAKRGRLHHHLMGMYAPLRAVAIIQDLL